MNINNNHYLFIDESGDLGIRGSKYLILAGLFVEDRKSIDKILKNARRNKFKKELSKTREIKASSSSTNLVEYLLKNVNKTNSKIFCSVLDKNSLKNPILINDKHLLYNHVAGNLAEQIVLKDDTNVIIDKSKSKKVHIEEFDRYFLNKLSYADNINIDIYHYLSHLNNGLQIVDVIAWAFYQHYEYNNDYYTKFITNLKKSISII